MKLRCYLTGTDTGIGKTHSAVALLHALQASGGTAAGMKPLASGCERSADGWRNADALALQQASSPRPAYADVNPWALPEPTAPEISALRAGLQVRLEPVETAYRRLQAQADSVVVEGVGGWMAPLADGLMQVDLVRRLQLPVIVTVGLRLGCINHALLTARALDSDGVRVLGWIANHIDPSLAFATETLAILRRRLSLPFLGPLPFGVDPALAASGLTLPEPDAPPAIAWHGPAGPR